MQTVVTPACPTGPPEDVQDAGTVGTGDTGRAVLSLARCRASPGTQLPGKALSPHELNF